MTYCRGREYNRKMKIKCISCNRTTGKRHCPALNALICSGCCGTKRLKEINCPSDCSYLETGMKNQMNKEISQTISETFKTERDDIFQNDEVVYQLAAPFEKYLADNFHDNKEVNDNDIHKILSKIYMFLSKKTNDVKTETEAEVEIFDNFSQIFDKSKLSDVIKAKTILRILMSINKTSGGSLGTRSYLNFINMQFQE